MSHQISPEKFLTESEVSALTGRAVQSLRNDRCNSRGFPYIKLFGHQIRYKLSDVLAAMERDRIVPEGSGRAGRGGA
jgi:hypothetical protein